MLVRQVKYAFDLLEYFAQRRSPATLTEISDHFGWPRSSTFNLLETLSQGGYLHEPRLRGGYYPSRRLLSLSLTLADNEPVPAWLSETVLALARDTGETAILGAVSGVNAVYLDVVESDQAIRYFAKPGDLVPLYATAIGRALMSLMTEKELRSVINRTEFRRYADNTPTSEGKLRKYLIQTKESGYSINDNGYEPHLLGIAMPFDLHGWRMALMVAGPSFRMRDDVPKIADMLRSRLSARVGI